MKRFPSHALLVAILFAALGTISACGTEPDQAGDAAGSDPAEKATSGRVVVYTALEDDQLERYLDAFYAAYPDIEVDLVRDSTGIVTAKLLAEKENPNADVVWGLAATSLIVADQEGILEPYAPEGIERVSDRFRDSADPPKWVGIDVWMSAFCVNTIELEKLGLPMPASWADLTDPAYRGHLVMPDPSSSGTGFLSVSSFLQSMGEEEGWGYMDELHENMAVYTHSGSKPCKLAGQGEYPIGVSFGYRGIMQQEKGEPVEIVFPVEGSGWDMEANALVSKPDINPAALTFLDWAISDSAMAEYAESFAITAAPSGEPVPEGFPEDPQEQLIDNDFEWAAANRDAILAEWTVRYDAKSEPEE